MKKQSTFSVLKIFYITITLIVILSLYNFYDSLEPYFLEEDKGYQGEALTNDYLAAEYFLLRMGQKTKEIKLFSSTQAQLEKQDTLLVPSVRLSFDRRRSDEMLAWVKSGGHLIITGQVDREKLSGQQDHILSSVGLFIDRKILPEDSEKGEYPVDIVSLSDDQFLQVDFDDYLIISKTTEFNTDITWVANDGDRTHALQIKLGNGKLTVLSDMRMFKNDYIDSYDHAAFLISLAQNKQLSLPLNKNTSVFYYSLFEDQMNLLQWLWGNAYLLLVSVFILMLIILWMLIPRFGPLINIGLPIRREFLKHLAAAGNYHWRMGNYNRLLDDVRIKLSHAVKRKYPEWVNLNKADKIQHFSDISRLDKDQIELALFNSKIEQINDFITTMKLLEILRKSL